MDKKEISRILQRLHDTHPGFTITSGIASSWEEEFREDSFKNVQYAVNRFIRTNINNLPPTIARIRALMPDQASCYMASREKDENGHEIRYFLRNQNFVISSGKIWKLGERYSTRRMRADELQEAQDLERYDIIDQNGMRYADPDEEVNKMLKSRVRATGRL